MEGHRPTLGLDRSPKPRGTSQPFVKPKEKAQVADKTMQGRGGMHPQVAGKT